MSRTRGGTLFDSFRCDFDIPKIECSFFMTSFRYDLTRLVLTKKVCTKIRYSLAVIKPAAKESLKGRFLFLVSCLFLL